MAAHLPDATHFCDVFGGSAAVLFNREPSPARQTRTGLAQASSEGRWAHCVLTSRAGMAGAVSRWLGSVEGLAEIAQRLQRVQIENAPALDVIARYDTPETVFYLDPPYVHSARGDSSAYEFEMTDDDHAELAAVLSSIRGRAVLSGYRTPLYDELHDGWTASGLWRSMAMRFRLILVVTTALMETLGEAFGLFPRVESQGLNEPDAATGMPADVMCYGPDGDLRLAVEVKDRDLTRSGASGSSRLSARSGPNDRKRSRGNVRSAGRRVRRRWSERSRRYVRRAIRCFPAGGRPAVPLRGGANASGAAGVHTAAHEHAAGGAGLSLFRRKYLTRLFRPPGPIRRPERSVPLEPLHPAL